MGLPGVWVTGAHVLELWPSSPHLWAHAQPGSVLSAVGQVGTRVDVTQVGRSVPRDRRQKGPSKHSRNRLCVIISLFLF